MSVPYATDKHQNKSVLYSQNTIQNDATIKNNDKIQSCETSTKQSYNIPTISTPNHHTQRIVSTSLIRLDLKTTTELPSVGK